MNPGNPLDALVDASLTSEVDRPIVGAKRSLESDITDHPPGDTHENPLKRQCLELVDKIDQTYKQLEIYERHAKLQAEINERLRSELNDKSDTIQTLRAKIIELERMNNEARDALLDYERQHHELMATRLHLNRVRESILNAALLCDHRLVGIDFSSQNFVDASADAAAEPVSHGNIVAGTLSETCDAMTDSRPMSCATIAIR